MISITKKISFNNDIETVFKTVTDLNNQYWRCNLDKLEIINQRQFIEYTTDGFQTLFTTKELQENKSWIFSFENNNIIGSWQGYFSFENNVTTLEFTETIKAKKLILKPFLKPYLNKQMNQYLVDLKKIL